MQEQYLGGRVYAMAGAPNPRNETAGDFIPPSDFDAERGEPQGP